MRVLFDFFRERLRVAEEESPPSRAPTAEQYDDGRRVGVAVSEASA